jgi:hypothetical protein
MKINKKPMSLRDARKIARNLERNINRLTSEPLRIPVQRRSTGQRPPDNAA